MVRAPRTPKNMVDSLAVQVQSRVEASAARREDTSFAPEAIWRRKAHDDFSHSGQAPGDGNRAGSRP